MFGTLKGGEERERERERKHIHQQVSTHPRNLHLRGAVGSAGVSLERGTIDDRYSKKKNNSTNNHNIKILPYIT